MKRSSSGWQQRAKGCRYASGCCQHCQRQLPTPSTCIQHTAYSPAADGVCGMPCNLLKVAGAAAFRSVQRRLAPTPACLAGCLQDQSDNLSQRDRKVSTERSELDQQRRFQKKQGADLVSSTFAVFTPAGLLRCWLAAAGSTCRRQEQGRAHGCVLSVNCLVSKARGLHAHKSGVSCVLCYDLLCADDKRGSAAQV